MGQSVTLLNLNIQLTISRFNAGYCIFQKTNDSDFKFEIIPYLGARYYNVKLDAAILDSVYSGSTGKTWFDPIIGISLPISYKRFLFNIKGDFGGSGSKASWMVDLQIHYRISKLVDVKLGWTHLDMKLKSIVEDKNLELRLRLAGPTAGVGFRF